MLPARCVSSVQAEAWRNRHFEERVQYLRKLIANSEASRWGLTTRPKADFPKVQREMLAEYRRLVGEVPTAASPLRPRSELVLSTKKYRACRVLLNLTGGIEVYGNLLVPEGIHGRAAAVVCQHGLSGTPEMITGIGQKEDTPYHEFGRRLAERGYVVFAPLILHYHPVEWTNQQVRMADAVGMMRAALAVAQTRRVVDFLQSLPFVDPKRIGYYGLSYGGYSALWISPLEERLAVVVVSGHFNDWRSKITADTTATSYLLHPDEDFYNWDILHRFTHVELVAMDAPRPVCIEYGTRDGITTPEWTAYAWKQLAAVRDHLGLSGRIILAQFDGVHEVRGEESFVFLDRFLR
jgi:dienelactone hydrolase